MVAVASLQSFISVFPVLFLPKCVNAGKIATVDVDGTILSIDFLEDDEGVPGDAILVALLQKDKEQVIALYTVGVPPDSSCGLHVTYVGSMITCATHPDDVAVARATSKLTGESVRPTPPAVAVTRLAGCPFLFAVFVEGKIIAGDARSVIVNAQASKHANTPPVGDNFMLQRQHQSELRILDDPGIPHEGIEPVTSAPQLHSYVPTADPDDIHTPGSPAPGTDPANNQNQAGFVTPTQTPAAPRTEPPAVNFSRRARLQWRDNIPPQLPLMTRCTFVSRYPYTGQSDFNVDDDYLPYLFVPTYISLDVGEANGVATAWVDARDHFCDENGDGSGLYFVMESGAMFVLRWSDSVKKGATTFRIPGGDRTRTSPKRNFRVQYVGDVGPAVSIASLDNKLIYVANDAADGSLRQLRLPTEDEQFQPSRAYVPSLGNMQYATQRYGLDVRQEFLNMCPVTDFIIVPSKIDACRDRRHRKNRSLAPRPKRGTSSAMDRRIQNLALTDISSLSGQVPMQQTALDHAIYGSTEESEIIACTGTGRQGCLRIIRPGAPVSVLAASQPAFHACNDIWPIRLTRDSKYDAGLLLSFAQASGLFLSLPPDTSGHDSDRSQESSTIAQLVDGTDAMGILSIRRTIEVGVIEDGVIAQIHEDGVRFVFLREAGDVDLTGKVVGNSLRQPLYSKILDWHPPEEGVISVGTIGAGFIIVSLVRPTGLKPMLYMLKCFPSAPTRGLCIVASTMLDHELSCIKIPEWTIIHSESDISSPRLPPMVVLGTYAPSVEVRLLGPALEVVDRRTTRPWDIRPEPYGGRDESSFAGDTRGLGDNGRTSRSASNRTERKSELVYARMQSNLMTAVPESLCAIEIDRRRLVFAGLRDGSVMCFTFAEEDDSGLIAPDSPNAAGHLRVELHRKLGYRPVVVKSMKAPIGRIVLCQAERPWMCTSHGGRKLRWIPLAFPETNALCSFSVFGAERCFATVAEDNALYICTLREKSEVSVRSILLGSTPRRVVEAPLIPDCVVVATTRDHGTVQSTDDQGGLSDANVASASEFSQLSVYSKRTRLRLGKVSLLNGELVHFMMRWKDLLVVGTSWGLRDLGRHKKCTRGRFLLYTLRSTANQGSSEASEDRVRFRLCCEIVLPGAVLAGAPHPTADLFALSCNDQVILLALLPTETALIEVARASVRTLVVSLSIHEDIVCVVDRKDSVTFFQIHTKQRKLVRDRSDHRKRLVSDAVLIDRTQMIGVDRVGALFSLGYEEGDAPKRSVFQERSGAVISPFIPILLAAGPDDFGEEINHALRSPEEPPPALGEEYDVMNVGSESDTPPETTEQADETDASNGTGDQQDEQGMQMLVDNQVMDNVNEDDGDAGSGEENNEDDNADDNEVVPMAGEAISVPGSIEGEVIDPEQDARRKGVPRNLVCYHTFHMKDIALRIRVGCFSRSEKVREIEEWDREAGSLSTMEDKPFFSKGSNSVFCGTVGGAIISAVSMSPEAYELLSKVESELGKRVERIGRKDGSAHEKFRAAYGRRAMFCVDGDLLEAFDDLDGATKQEIADQVGCGGEKGVLRIEGTIWDLCDRVG